MRSRGAVLSILPFLVVAALTLGFVALPFPRVPQAAPHATVIVLGAAQYAGRPSPAFKRRLDHALALYRQGQVKTIVVTGGRRPNDPFSEGEVGVGYLKTQGVPDAALLAETRSRTTIENLRNARLYLPPQTAVTLVTDEAHAPRALALAQALGMVANVNPSPLSGTPDWRYLVREKLALAAYAVLGVGG